MPIATGPVYQRLREAGLGDEQANALAERVGEADRDRAVPVSIKVRMARAETGAEELEALLGVCADRRLARDLRDAAARHDGRPGRHAGQMTRDDMDRIGWLQARFDDVAARKARELGVK